MSVTRREVLAGAGKLLVLTSAAAAALESAGGAAAETAPTEPSYKMAEHWWGMLIDVDKCIGCGSCVRGCEE